MSTQFEYKVCESQDQYVKVLPSGPAGVNDILYMYQDICDQAKTSQANKLLFDMTAMELDYPMTELLPLMKKLEGLLSNFKVARICNVFEFRQDLIENISAKANIQLRNFGDESEALTWLLESKSS